METTENWIETVRGTRGAVPMAEADFLEYGGNTSCISVCCCGELVVFDAGSGIVRLDAGAGRRAHILFSHMHPDHIQGLAGLPLLPAWVQMRILRIPVQIGETGNRAVKTGPG